MLPKTSVLWRGTSTIIACEVHGAAFTALETNIIRSLKMPLFGSMPTMRMLSLLVADLAFLSLLKDKLSAFCAVCGKTCLLSIKAARPCSFDFISKIPSRVRYCPWANSGGLPSIFTNSTNAAPGESALPSWRICERTIDPGSSDATNVKTTDLGKSLTGAINALSFCFCDGSSKLKRISILPSPFSTSILEL